VLKFLISALFFTAKIILVIINIIIYSKGKAGFPCIKSIYTKPVEENLNYNTLIIKFLSQEISETELEELRSWLEKDPANRRLFDEENALWHDSSIRTKFDYFKTDKAW